MTQQGGRSNHVLAVFLKTFAKEDDLKVIPLFAESFHLGYTFSLPLGDFYMFFLVLSFLLK